MLRVKAIYDPAQDSEAQLKTSMMQKCVMVERPRPDPLQRGLKWEQIVAQQGLTYAAVIDEKLKQHNQDPDEAVKLNPNEATFGHSPTCPSESGGS